MPAGRPSTFSTLLANQIVIELAKGTPVRALCKMEGMPEPSTIYKWLIQHPEFAEQYARSKEIACENLVDECLEIADDGSNDWMASNDPNNPGWRFNGEHAQRSRLRVDTRKWIASKLLPKKYGDRLEVEGSGLGSQTLVQINIIGANGLPTKNILDGKVDIGKGMTRRLKPARSERKDVKAKKRPDKGKEGAK